MKFGASSKIMRSKGKDMMRFAVAHGVWHGASEGRKDGQAAGY